ncbi:MAG: LysM peptidoglycan-binding domain-containing protein [Chloroflexota bacterium]|nr:LysM peptidoglycan-binding domain-containing protein [Chloroflexota bacterium]
MKRTALIMVSLVVLLGVGIYVFGQAQQAALAQVEPGDAALVQDVYTRLNTLRMQVGVQPLRFNALLAAAAYEHASYQVIHTWWGHQRPDGSLPADRAAAAGYVGAIRCCGENYYMSIDATPELVWNFFYNSPPHYGNLTNEWYNDVGIAVATNGYRKSYVMVFGVGPAVPISAPVPMALPVPVDTVTTATADEQSSTQLVDGTMVITYIVQRGDRMIDIANRFGTTVEIIARTNRIANPNRLMPGDSLLIPVTSAVPEATVIPTVAAPTPAPAQAAPAAAGTQTHTVARGENLYRIALRYGTTVAALAAANNLSDPTRIYVGQVLVIPGM